MQDFPRTDGYSRVKQLKRLMNRPVSKILASPYRENAAANPVQSLLYDAMERNGVHICSYSGRKLLRDSWDVWHLHWPAEYIVNRGNARHILRRLLVFWLGLKVAHFKRTKVFWTVHNVRPHERSHPWLEWIFWRIFLANVGGIICMSEAGKQKLFREHPRALSIPIFTIPHGHYRGAYPDAMNKDEARAFLGISPERFVALFIGQIRPYKGVSKLIRCFSEAQLGEADLLIAGQAGEPMAREIQNASAAASSVKLALGFVGHEDVQKYLRAADLVILPYTEILNSGTAILALSFDRPILVPARGALAELHTMVGPDWVRLYEGEISTQIVRSAVQWTKARSARPDARAPLEMLDWDHIARLTLRAFSGCFASQPTSA